MICPNIITLGIAVTASGIYGMANDRRFKGESGGHTAAEEEVADAIQERYGRRAGLVRTTIE